MAHREERGRKERVEISSPSPSFSYYPHNSEKQIGTEPMDLNDILKESAPEMMTLTFGCLEQSSELNTPDILFHELSFDKSADSKSAVECASVVLPTPSASLASVPSEEQTLQQTYMDISEDYFSMPATPTCSEISSYLSSQVNSPIGGATSGAAHELSYQFSDFCLPQQQQQLQEEEPHLLLGEFDSQGILYQLQPVSEQQSSAVVKQEQSSVPVLLHQTANDELVATPTMEEKDGGSLEEILSDLLSVVDGKEITSTDTQLFDLQVAKEPIDISDELYDFIVHGSQQDETDKSSMLNIDPNQQQQCEQSFIEMKTEVDTSELPLDGDGPSIAFSEFESLLQSPSDSNQVLPEPLPPPVITKTPRRSKAGRPRRKASRLSYKEEEAIVTIGDSNEVIVSIGDVITSRIPVQVINPAAPRTPSLSCAVAGGTLDEHSNESPSSSGTKRKRSPRMNYNALSAEEKYQRIRDINNEASKRCRENRKIKEKGLTGEIDVLEMKNRELREKLESMTNLRDSVKEYVYTHVFNMKKKKNNNRSS